jgi:glycosyltransferase involved in cell wall biosynthesis
MKNNFKTAFVHGRPAPHPRNKALAESISAELYLVDKHVRYHDLEVSKLRRYVSWIIDAVLFPVRKYQVIITLGVMFPQILLRAVGLLPKKNKKLIGLIVGEELYFLYSGYYSKSTGRFMHWVFTKYDILICKGQMQLDMAREIFGEKCPQLYKILNGLSEKNYSLLKTITPDLNSFSIITVAHGPSGFRIWYKGLDTMIAAFVKAKHKINDLTFTIIGHWVESDINSLLKEVPMNFRSSIYFIGEKNLKEVCEYYSKSALFLLISRGDCFPNASLECMAAGVTPMVSEWTGTKELIAKVDSHLITPINNAEEVSDRLIWYFNLPAEEKKNLSERCRTIISEYTEERNIELFKKTFEKIMQTDNGKL